MPGTKNTLMDVPNKKTSLLIRKSSFHSLVSIPTYITCHIHLTDITPDNDSSQPFSDTKADISLVERLSTNQSIISEAANQPIITEETQENMQLVEQRLTCLATVFCVCCLMMVGTMFAVTSQYQDMIVATMINVSNHHLNTIDAET